MDHRTMTSLSRFYLSYHGGILIWGREGEKFKPSVHIWENVLSLLPCAELRGVKNIFWRLGKSSNQEVQQNQDMHVVSATCFLPLMVPAPPCPVRKGQTRMCSWSLPFRLPPCDLATLASTVNVLLPVSQHSLKPDKKSCFQLSTLNFYLMKSCSAKHNIILSNAFLT